MVDCPPEAHVGCYLVGDGRPGLCGDIGFRAEGYLGRVSFIRAHARDLYFGALCLTAAVLVVVLTVNAGRLGVGWWLLTALAIVLPVTELAVGIVNCIVTKVVPPNTLPKLDFSNGVPAECATFVVIPTLLTSMEGAAALAERLETHYLSNPDPQLRFALLTDWADAPSEQTPGDERVVQTALDGITALNRRYAAGGPPLFFVFHRRRLWNAVERKWMGWERKRGKLSEFNRLLLGANDTSYAVTSVPPKDLPRVRYVITRALILTRRPRPTFTRTCSASARLPARAFTSCGRSRPRRATRFPRTISSATTWSRETLPAAAW